MGGESSGLTEMPASASAARSYSSKVHSTGTVMVAGEAGSADTVMQPPWSRQAGNCSLQGGWGLSQQPAIPALTVIEVSAMLEGTSGAVTPTRKASAKPKLRRRLNTVAMRERYGSLRNPVNLFGF